MIQPVWESLNFSEMICPSCGNSWCPTVQKPVSCPRCKSYTISKNCQPWPDEFTDVNFIKSDFEIQDLDWIAEQNKIDRQIRLQKRAIFEKIYGEWKREFDEREKKSRVDKIIRMFKEKEPPCRYFN